MAGALKLLAAYMFGGKRAVKAMREKEAIKNESSPILTLGTVSVPISVQASSQPTKHLVMLYFSYNINKVNGARGFTVDMTGATGDAHSLAKLTEYYHENAVPWVTGGEWELITPIRITTDKRNLPDDFRKYLEADWPARVMTRKLHSPFEPTPVTPTPAPGGKPNVVQLRPVS